MSATRYTRDEIIIQGLELADSPTLLQKELPGGSLRANALSIKWLQNALDRFHRQYPFSGDLKSVDCLLQANNNDITLLSNSSLYLPENFIIDVRDGVIIHEDNGSYRLKRKSFQYWLNTNILYQNNPVTSPRGGCYTIIDDKIKVAPLIDNNKSITLWYYALPEVLQVDSPIKFPDEFVLIEFISLKALEWTRAIKERGTAEEYLKKRLAGFRASGLLNEPEYESAIPIENNQVIPETGQWNRNNWMGNYAS